MNYLSTSRSGAMFGLDARLALAIFGILSVVVGGGSVAYFAQANTSAMTMEMGNYKKAYIEFVLSTGVDTTRFTDLLKNDQDHAGWQGPYLDIASDKHNRYGTLSLMEGRDDMAAAPPSECVEDGTCAIFIKLTEVPQALAKKVDAAFDGSESGTNGNLRYQMQQGGLADVYYRLSRKQ